MKVDQYDTVLLKNGSEGCVVEVLDGNNFMVDVGDSPSDWKTIIVTADEIESVISEKA